MSQVNVDPTRSESSALDRFVAWQRDYNDVSAERLRAIERELADFATHVGGPPETGTAQDFAAWMTDLAASGLHVNTVRKKGNMVRPFFKWARRERLVSSETALDIGEVPNPRGATSESKPNPYKRVEISRLWPAIDAAYPKAPTFVKRWLAGRSRYPRVWRHAMGLQVEAVTMLALHAGLRRMEIFRCEIVDIHPDNAYVVVRAPAQKGNGEPKPPREVPMTVELRRALAAWLDFRALLKPEHDRPWLVLHPSASPNGVHPSSPAAPLSMRSFKRLLGDLGFELHRLRHTCGTEWLRAEMPLENVQSLLGHSRLQQTLAYAEIVAGDIQRQAHKAEAAFTRALSRPLQEAA